ncbi:MAG: HAD-IA family hydrolase [Christensenellaceae bacterium]|nr:HAD-IA family hydrolase [Christensenellaceae bacterium]
MKKKTLVFDIGSVLITLDFPAALKKMGLSAEAQQVIAAIPSIDGLWDCLDRNDLDIHRGAEIYAECAPGFEAEATKAFLTMTEYVQPIEENVSVLRDASRAGYDTYFLSNFQRDNWAILQKNLSFFRHFKGGTVSWQESEIKPGPAIYERFLSKYGLVAEDCIFIDDKAVNTATARSLGFATITFAGGVNVREELAKMGITL